jgi:hypothetical protein
MTSLMVINQEKVAKLESRADAAEAAISSLREELLSVKTRMGGDIVNLQSELTAAKITLNARISRPGTGQSNCLASPSPRRRPGPPTQIFQSSSPRKSTIKFFLPS